MLSLIVTEASLRPRAEALAAELGLRLIPNHGGLRDLHLRLSESGLGLVLPGGAEVRAEFVAGRMGYRRTHDLGRNQPLARALGLNRGLRDLVDATAGLGRDAFMLAANGARIRLLERAPIVAALLADGLRRATLTTDTAAVAERMHLHITDAADWLSDLPTTARPEAVYLDPMYPDSGKTAQVKKEMQALRELLGPDLDSAGLLAAALACARERVVVKRPRGAPVIDGPAPDYSINSPNTRYDVYRPR